MTSGYQDYRAIPMEVLRDFALSRCDLTSIRAVASELGMGRSTLHKLISGETKKPHPRVRRLLGLWYLRKLEEAEDIDIIRPYVAALSLLTSTLPASEQESAQKLLAEDLSALHGMYGPVPRWLELLNLSGPVR